MAIHIKKEITMAIKSKEELIKQINDKFGEDNSDEVIALLEDISDTFDDLTDKATNGSEWKTKYEDSVKKYRERFMQAPDKSEDLEQDDTEVEETEELKTFEDLFKTE